MADRQKEFLSMVQSFGDIEYIEMLRLINRQWDSEKARQRKTEDGELRARAGASYRSAKARAHGICAITLEDWILILRAADGVCAYCEARVGIKFLSMEHIIPLSASGETSVNNVVAICFHCNTWKNGSLIDRPKPFKCEPIARQADHVTIRDLAAIVGMSVPRTWGFLLERKLYPVGVCDGNGKTVLFNQAVVTAVKEAICRDELS